MHPCLSVDEVQRAIFLEVYNDVVKGKATLARLARTCRIFSNAALDRLWAKIDSIEQLVQCLPKDLWEIHRDSTRSQSRTLKFKRDLSPIEWTTLLKYSSRVRTLSGVEGYIGYHRLDDDVIFALSQPPNHVPLVPNLQILDWTQSDIKYTPLFQILLTPSLVEVSLPSFSMCSSVISRQFTSKCPSLKRLRIADFSSIGADDLKIMSKAISHLQSLESLECPKLDEAGIIYLSQLPSLTNLSLWSLDVKNIIPSLALPAFASLKSLELRVDKLITLTSLLESIQPILQRVSFSVVETPTPVTIEQFYIALAQVSHPQRLSYVCLEQHPQGLRRLFASEHHTITLSTLHPILGFPNISEFILGVLCNISFDDDAIGALANHWPKLTTLSLNASFGWGIKSLVTHHGLITLLSRCSALAYLTLAVDFSAVDQEEIPRSRPGKGVVSGCQTADFLESEIHHPITIAAFLSDLCPEMWDIGNNIDMFIMGRRDFDRAQMSENWKVVGKHLSDFQTSGKVV